MKTANTTLGKYTTPTPPLRLDARISAGFGSKMGHYGYKHTPKGGGELASKGARI